jgi:muramidase (phage lysozyme)
MRFFEFAITENVLTVPTSRVGPAVRDVQQALVALGYSVSPPGEPDTARWLDGIRGPYTVRAVKQFQSEYGLRVDGDPGPETVAKLNEIISATPTLAGTIRKSTSADVRPSKIHTGTRASMQPISQSAATGAVGRLLDYIGQLESGGDYTRIIGGSRLASLTSMTLDEVFALQKDLIAKKHPSSAIGRYQFVYNTLRETVNSMNLNTSTTRFSPAVQDALIIQRLRNVRQLDGWLSGQVSDTRFLNNLSQEFAAIPSPAKGGRSYHHGVGNNRALDSLANSMAALATIKQTDTQDV